MRGRRESERREGDGERVRAGGCARVRRGREGGVRDVEKIWIIICTGWFDLTARMPVDKYSDTSTCKQLGANCHSSHLFGQIYSFT